MLDKLYRYNFSGNVCFEIHFRNNPLYLVTNIEIKFRLNVCFIPYLCSNGSWLDASAIYDQEGKYYLFHYCSFSEFLPKNYLRPNSILGTNKLTISENKNTVCIAISKVKITMSPLFFLISYSLVPKIEICLEKFLDKSSK